MNTRDCPPRRAGLASRWLCTVLCLCVALLPMRTALAQSAAAPAGGSCVLLPASKTCIDATPCKTGSDGIPVCLAGVSLPKDGISMAQTCWQYSYQYACSTQTVDTCAPYRADKACSVVNSSCQDTDPTTGKCTQFLEDYRCMTQAAQTSTKTVCAGGLFDSSAYPTPTNTNQNFANAALAQEILRETQTYSQQGKEIFGGVQEGCRKGYAGLQNCCKAAPGAKSNAAMVTQVIGPAASVVKYYGAQAIDWASSYVFDAMYNSGIFSEALASTFATGGETLGTNLASSGFSIGAYGFTYSTTAATATGGATTGATGGGLFGGDTIVANFGGDGVITFNPYVLAAVVVITVIMNMASCSNAEQLLAMHKGAKLSTYVRTDCSSSFLGVCMGYTDTYCSFNSVLAKIINLQGKTQLGRDTADCHGLTVEQISQIDFSKIDFSEFLGDINQQANAGLPDTAQLTSSYQAALKDVSSGSAQSGAMATGSNIVGDSKSSTPPTANPNLPGYPKP